MASPRTWLSQVSAAGAVARPQARADLRPEGRRIKHRPVRGLRRGAPGIAWPRRAGPAGRTGIIGTRRLDPRAGDEPFLSAAGAPIVEFELGTGVTVL